MKEEPTSKDQKATSLRTLGCHKPVILKEIIGILCKLLENQLNLQNFQLSAFLQQDTKLLAAIISVLDDTDMEVRMGAVVSVSLYLRLAGRSIKDSDMQTLYPHLLKRLDDTNDAIRTEGAKAISAYLNLLPAAGVAERADFFSMVNSLLVHLDDANPAVQSAVADPLEKAVNLEPAMLGRLLQAAKPSHHNPTYVDRLLSLAATIQR
eukprot:TRINITY_DN5711_c0_g1_i2.p1 TRINITY_DN5711_c0_g1~~TRINITY_DN5711_c0_g1_i2.p1  ORF type:complete len:208 (-),score=40.74 TRINITY_DN5711_c0_g1_i2:101-724(-)